MIVMGKFSYETGQLNVVLSSENGLDSFADNSPVNFANMMPDEIVRSASTDGLYVRLRSLAFARSLRLKPRSLFGARPIQHTAMHVLLDQLDWQTVGNQNRPLLAVLDVKKLSNVLDLEGTTCGEYTYLTFPQAPFLKLRDARLLHLRVRLTSIEGQPVHVLPNTAPTLVHLEINARAGAMQEFTLTSMSHPPEEPGSTAAVYPKNTLTDFTANLPRSANMKGWEAAISSVALPPHLNSEDKVKFVIFYGNQGDSTATIRADDGKKYEFSCYLSEVSTAQDLLTKIHQDMQSSSLVKDKLFLEKVMVADTTSPQVVGATPPTKPVWRMRNSQTGKRAIVALNRVMAVILGHGYVHLNIPVAQASTAAGADGAAATAVETEVTMTGAFFQESLANTICPPDVCFARCSLVEPTVVGNGKSSTMGMLPLRRMSGEDDDAILYEPKHMTYFHLIDQDVGFFRFNLVRPDGQDFTLLPKLTNRDKMTATGGAMITLRIRPRVDDAAVGYYRPRKLPRTLMAGGYGGEGEELGRSFTRNNEGYM